MKHEEKKRPAKQIFCRRCGMRALVCSCENGPDLNPDPYPKDVPREKKEPKDPRPVYRRDEPTEWDIYND